MRRLYLQVYLTLIAILLGFSVLTGLLWFLAPEHDAERRVIRGFGEVLAELIPQAGSPQEEIDVALRRLSERLHVDVALRDTDGRLIAAAGDQLPAPRLDQREEGWFGARGGGTAVLPLPDGRILVGRPTRHRHGMGWLAALAGLAGVTALGAYPVVRRLTGRLERLRDGVENLGAGDLGARVEVEGRDEVAALASSFNRAAERIQQVVGAQRNMLASASHELRSPLTRIQMATELLAGEQRPELKLRVAGDIAELDALIYELLLASRLDVIDELDETEDVDLLALAAEEGARCDARVSGEAASLRGDPRMLRRLVRNLIENARRHGDGTPIEVEVEPTDEGVAMRVMDRGPGVAEDERERIFEPFYRPAGLRESRDGGVGLGLSLVRQIASHHRGEVRCLPRDGGGTCFEVDLRGALVA